MSTYRKRDAPVMVSVQVLEQILRIVQVLLHAHTGCMSVHNGSSRGSQQVERQNMPLTLGVICLARARSSQNSMYLQTYVCEPEHFNMDQCSRASLRSPISSDMIAAIPQKLQAKPPPCLEHQYSVREEPWHYHGALELT
eukprot:1142642-Pelagomonas_calceolata.AAC.10